MRRTCSPDVAALAIAVAAVRVARRPADARRTFGYHRFEILAAAFNAVLLFGVALYILYEAYGRFNAPSEVQPVGMLVVAVLGLLVNLVSMRLLRSGKDTSLNVKGAYLEVWADMLGSVGVIVAAIVIRFSNWVWVDTVVAVGIGLWVLPRTWVLLKESLDILLEGAPEGVDVEKVEETIAAVPGVTGVHDLHVWVLTSGKNAPHGPCGACRWCQWHRADRADQAALGRRFQGLSHHPSARAGGLRTFGRRLQFRRSTVESNSCGRRVIE